MSDRIVKHLISHLDYAKVRHKAMLRTMAQAMSTGDTSLIARMYVGLITQVTRTITELETLLNYQVEVEPIQNLRMSEIDPIVRYIEAVLDDVVLTKPVISVVAPCLKLTASFRSLQSTVNILYKFEKPYV